MLILNWQIAKPGAPLGQELVSSTYAWGWGGGQLSAAQSSSMANVCPLSQCFMNDCASWVLLSTGTGSSEHGCLFLRDESN